MRGRGLALRRQSIAQGFDAVRILADAKSGQMKPLGAYFDELMPEEEMLDHSAQQLADHFEAMIEKQEARAARAGK